MTGTRLPFGRMQRAGGGVSPALPGISAITSERFAERAQRIGRNGFARYSGIRIFVRLERVHLCANLGGNAKIFRPMWDGRLFYLKG